MKTIIAGALLLVLGLAVLLYNRSQVAVGNDPSDLAVGLVLLAMVIGLAMVIYGVVGKFTSASPKP